MREAFVNNVLLNLLISPITAFSGLSAEGLGDGKVAFRKNLGSTLFYLSLVSIAT